MHGTHGHIGALGHRARGAGIARAPKRGGAGIYDDADLPRRTGAAEPTRVRVTGDGTAGCRLDRPVAASADSLGAAAARAVVVETSQACAAAGRGIGGRSLWTSGRGDASVGTCALVLRDTALPAVAGVRPDKGPLAVGRRQLAHGYAATLGACAISASAEFRAATEGGTTTVSGIHEDRVAVVAAVTLGSGCHLAAGSQSVAGPSILQTPAARTPPAAAPGGPLGTCCPR